MTASGTINAWAARPIQPVLICPQIIGTVNGVFEAKIATSARNVPLPRISAVITAGKAMNLFFAIAFENSPDTTAKTVSSAIMNGSLAAAGIAEPNALVIR